MELHTLFNGYIYGDNLLVREQPKHWHFWLPLLAYYTGAYSDEIGNLRCQDIKKDSADIYYFDFHTHGKIKPRHIPIHPALQQAGFFDYLDYVKRQQHNRLLFDLPAKSGRYSEKVRIWFSGEGKRSGYLQKCGLPNVDQQGLKTAISSLRLNFEQQIRIHAIQANAKPAFNYLMGFNDYPNQHFNDTALLASIVSGVRAITSHTHWQRFVERT